MPYIGKSPSFGVRNRFVYVASSGDTSVSGADANGATLTFTDGAFVDVYLNGVLLKPTTDYNTSTANTIAGLSALNTSDEVTVVVYDVFAVADTVSATSGGTFSGNVTFNSDITVGDDIILNSDSAAIKFGADSELTLTHSADSGLFLKHAATGDDKFPTLNFQAGDTDIAQNDVLGRIAFTAPDEGTGTDAIAVAAQIQAISEGDFSASSNATSLAFATGASEAATEKMRIDSSGRVGIGVTDLTQYNNYGNGLIVEKSSTSGSAGMSLISATNGYGSIYFNDGTGNNTVGRIEYYHGSGAMGFAVEGTERLKLSSSGNLAVTADSDSGTAMIIDNNSNSNPFGLAVRYQNANDDNNSTYFFRGQDSVGAKFTVYSDGDVNTADAGTLSSDSKNKNTITDATGKWDDVKKLQVRNFYWNEAYHPNKKDKKMIGFIAQEFETVFPGLVNDLKDTNIKDDKVVDLGTTTKVIKEGKLIPILTKALQEAMERIETLEAKVKTLEEA